jgi:hypothetical protein
MREILAGVLIGVGSSTISWLVGFESNQIEWWLCSLSIIFISWIVVALLRRHKIWKSK